MPILTRKPSRKTLDAAFPGLGKQLRLLLDSDQAVKDNPAVIAWCKQCYHEPKMHEKRLCALDNVAGTYGVEYVRQGHNQKSPSFHYLNTGDLYNTTLVRVNERYVVTYPAYFIDWRSYD